MIVPTVGRVVWWWDGLDARASGAQPHAAIVVFVHNERLVNVAVFGQHPGTVAEVTIYSSVPLLQDGDMPQPGPSCEWMPYQKGQAAKLEETRAAFNEAKVLERPALLDESKPLGPMGPA